MAPKPVLAQGAKRVVDLTYTLTHDFTTYFGKQQFFDEDVFTYAKNSSNLKSLRVNEHNGTHIDARCISPTAAHRLTKSWSRGTSVCR